MSRKYIANTFSPMMLGALEWAEVTPIELDELPMMSQLTSVVSHEVTARVLSALMGEEVSFNRVNLILEIGDVLYCVIPNFRASEAREFTHEEVSGAGYRCFQVRISPKDCGSTNVEEREKKEVGKMERETFFECSDNNEIHALIDTDDGLIVRRLGDIPDEFLPGMSRADVDFDRSSPKLLRALGNLY